MIVFILKKFKLVTKNYVEDVFFGVGKQTAFIKNIKSGIKSFFCF